MVGSRCIPICLAWSSSDLNCRAAVADDGVMEHLDLDASETPYDGLTELRTSAHSTRRDAERRSDAPGRRPRDLALVRSLYVQAAIGVVSGLTAMVSAGLALFHPPVSRVPSATCADGFGGQFVVHRGLSWLWFPAVIAMVIALTLPDRRKRPALTLLCVGLVLGMGAGALLRVETTLVGYCLA
jgi:hypothetical protein